MVRKNKKGEVSYLTKVIVFAIILGILATVLLYTIGKKQIGNTENFFGDRFRNLIGAPDSSSERPVIEFSIEFIEDNVKIKV